MSSTDRIYQPNSFPFKRNHNKVLHGNNCKAQDVISPLYLTASVTQYKAGDGELYSEEFNVIDAKRCVDEVTHL